ncbi:max-binding protein MNT-like isoform X2 [Daktulosphaira vitifoliae]|uniref:max-binding protein MNT-like isoform X2 n=1 Tax=Daktulosphaira vitifoliae TaxID=58002 RepID=UPI0021AA15AB|nr:max-binding protein MNT-like isoform X2 [Daktulosphaira vitifoliae]
MTMGVLFLNVDAWVTPSPPKKKWIRHYLLEEPLSTDKDAGYHPTSVTLPSSDLPASLNHIEPPSTPPQQQQQQQQLHQQLHRQQLQPKQQTAAVVTAAVLPQLQQQHVVHHVYKPPVVNNAPNALITAVSTSSVVTAAAAPNSDDNVAALSLAQELKRRTGSGTREVHNKLEKNRRAHLKECFELLKKQVPASQDEKKTSNLSILRSAIRYIQVLRRRERELEHEMERLAREKIWAQQRHASLKKELAAKWDHIDFSKLIPELPPDVATRKTTIATSINGDFETEREASMATSDADDSKLSALYSSTSSLSSSSPPTLPLVSETTPHQVQVVSTSPMMGSTIHIVPQTRNSSSLPNNIQQQTLTFVHHKDALNQHEGTTQAVLTKVSNGSFTLYGDPKIATNRSKMSIAGIKISPSVIDHSNNAAPAPIRLLQNNILANQASVVNRGQTTPNHVITRPLLLTHHHTNSSPAHLVLSTSSSKAVTIPNQSIPPLSNGHLLVKPGAMVVMNNPQPKSHHSGHKA